MRLQVTAEDAGKRLDAILAVPLGSRARAQRLIDSGQVTVDGAAAVKSMKPGLSTVIDVDDTDRREASASTGPVAEFTVA